MSVRNILKKKPIILVIKPAIVKMIVPLTTLLFIIICSIYFRYSIIRIDVLLNGAEMENNMIYMDNAATTKTKKEVVDEMLKYFTILYGNPSSMYEFAGKSRDAVEKSREIIAKTINCETDEIFLHQEELNLTIGRLEMLQNHIKQKEDIL